MKPKVLLLEDDAVVAGEVHRGLRAIGCEVVLLRDGRIGLARAVSERFDAVVVASDLPGMNGFRVCTRIRKDATVGAVPLFLLGAASDTGFREHEKLAEHATAYLEKP